MARRLGKTFMNELVCGTGDQAGGLISKEERSLLGGVIASYMAIRQAVPVDAAESEQSVSSSLVEELQGSFEFRLGF